MSCAEFAVSWWSHRLSSASASVCGKNYEVGTIMVPGSRDPNNLSLPSPPKHTPLVPCRCSTLLRNELGETRGLGD